MRERAVRETERRLAGDVLAEALCGRLDERGAPGQPAAVRRSAPRPRCSSSSSRTRFAPPTTSRRRSPMSGITGAGRLDHGGAQARCSARSIDAGDGDPVEVARGARAALARDRGRGAGGGEPGLGGELAPPLLPRGPLRARGDLARQRQRPRGRLPPRPRRLHAAARAPGRRGAAPLLREPAGADRGHRGRVRRRAPALARGLHRAATASGSARRASSTATATRCATGSARSRSSPAAT